MCSDYLRIKAKEMLLKPVYLKKKKRFLTKMQPNNGCKYNVSDFNLCFPLFHQIYPLWHSYGAATPASQRSNEKETAFLSDDELCLFLPHEINLPG